MFFTRFATITVAAWLLWSGAVDAGGPLHPFKHGFWSGGAYTDDRTGAFTHCSAGVAYDSGINLFVLVTGEYHWWLGFIDPKWSMTARERAPIRLRLDANPPFERLAMVPNGQLLLVPLPDSSRLIDAFRHSSELALDAEGRSFQFKLDGTPAVMDRLASCLKTAAAHQTPGAAPPAAAVAAAKNGPGGDAGPQPAAAPVAAGAAGEPRTQTAGEASGAGPFDAPSGVQSPTSASRDKPPAPTETARTMPAPETNSAATAGAGPPSPAGSLSDGAVSAGAPPAPSPNTAPASSGAASASALPDPAKEPGPAPNAAITKRPEADAFPGHPDQSANAPVPPVQLAPGAAETPASPTRTTPAAGSPALAFTAVAPHAASAPASFLPPQLATATVREEIRLATEFLAKAQFREARLIVVDKPPALADFSAVWRSEDAAGAVKIIQPGPDVSAIGIASNLITVDPQVCRGDFNAARFRTDIGNRAVFSAVLSCIEANEQRVTEYFVAPRHQGGFAVFVVIRSKGIGEAVGFDRQNLDGLSRAAIEAVQAQG